MLLKRHLVYHIFGTSKGFYKYLRGNVVISKCDNLKALVFSERDSLPYKNKIQSHLRFFSLK